MKYQILWTDMHSNIHHEDIQQLHVWYQHAKKTLDFWPIAYYPYYVRKINEHFGVEDRHQDQLIEEDWLMIKNLAKQAEADGFPFYMGYEWQGSGQDGDHNVFFLDNDQKMTFPLRYEDLRDHYQNKPVIAIPHHLAYQLSDRGKNWSTHDETFSPVVEIFSSHGSSENDETHIEMKRHIHMGPRTGQTSVEAGLKDKLRFGIMASGDNHSCPAVYGFGLCAVLSEGNSKEDIWDAINKRRTYGVSKDRIKLEFTIDGMPMGSVIKANDNAQLKIKVEGSNAIDRIEIITNNIVHEMIAHTSTYENEPMNGVVKFKFQLELGWGPDRRHFADIDQKDWHGKLTTKGKIISVEKCWSTFKKEIVKLDDNSCQFNITTYKSTASGKWMGPSAITTEGFIFEIEDDINNAIHLAIEGQEYDIPIKQILDNSTLFGLYDEAKKLLEEIFAFTSYYRNDPFWHNAYKIKINKGVVEKGYKREISRMINTNMFDHIRVRIWQKDGSCAWSSPIFIDK